ncbi:hypothetical protein M5X17_15600 [Paenibacillus alvei]|uniref:hypothetical protein n=1 Tax=Paenibacillus alvei TaxID=44250 RepID=UPI0021CF9737|nr:hypothetical protein [Paenibacillus alvei]MCY9735142.1 hypothetical protein [Paenibacillus alvei]MCY9771053.1 hypothetical protein [Paenibacillus alvei]MEC0081519.1 hypothetical protein [Paenibacillus alvei]
MTDHKKVHTLLYCMGDLAGHVKEEMTIGSQGLAPFFHCIVLVLFILLAICLLLLHVRRMT